MPTEDLQIRFGARLRSLREQHHWTQDDLSEASGVGREHISRLENGRREVCLGLLGTLSRCFKITISDLMRGV